MWESYKLAAYIRLTPYAEMLLVGSCSPEHNSGDLIANYISKRFRKFVILVFTCENFHIQTERKEIKEFPKFQRKSEEEITNGLRCFLAERIEERLDEQYLLLDSDDLWEVFYASQYLSQRQNLKLYHRDIPKYMYRKANMKIEEDFYTKVTDKHKNNQKLDKFLSKEK